MNPDSIQVDVDEEEFDFGEDSDQDYSILMDKRYAKDIKEFENGIDLIKVYKKKKTCAVRNYKLDLVHKRLVASTKDWKYMKDGAKYYSLFNIRTVSNIDIKKMGLGGVLKILKKNNKDPENKAFELTYDKDSKVLYLIADNEDMRDTLAIMLMTKIDQIKGQKFNVTDKKDVAKTLFAEADVSKDGKLTIDEVWKFMKKKQIRITKEKFNELIKKIDKNNDGEFDQQEFLDLVKEFTKRPGIQLLFEQITTEGQSIVDQMPEFMTLNQFHNFVNKIQMESKTVEECREIFAEYEKSNKNDLLSLEGFISYLNHPAQYITDPKKLKKAYQDMNLPINNYWISSSHNTYLSGDQLKSESKASCYADVLNRGGRLLELDCHDTPEGPQIYHNYTFTSKLKFEDVIVAIKENAFFASCYPIILTLENHCSIANSDIMAEIITRQLGPKGINCLYNGVVDENMKQLPSLESLTNQIFIRSKSTKIKVSKFSCKKAPEKTVSDLDMLINIFKTKGVKSFAEGLEKNKPYQGTSISEAKCEKMLKKEGSISAIKLSNKIVCKLYPKGNRFDSSNLNPIPFWIHGFQLVALNFQSEDLAVELNEAMFNDNGLSGYVLKPKILRDLSLGFNPMEDKKLTQQPDKNGKKPYETLNIKIISAQYLPAPDNGYEMNTLVKINVHGIPSDEAQFKSKPIKGGCFPTWNEECNFKIYCPELAFIRFTVKDYKDVINGTYVIRYVNMRRGYRHFRLKNKQFQGQLFIRTWVS